MNNDQEYLDHCQRQMDDDESYKDWLNQYNTAAPIKPIGEMQVDMSQYSSSENSDLKAKDFVGKSLKVKIAEVTIRDYPATDDQPASSKPVLSFEGKEKVLVLNATNTKSLCTAYGDDSDEWLNREIGLTVADYTDKGFGHGWVVTPLDVPAPTFEDAPF